MAQDACFHAFAPQLIRSGLWPFRLLPIRRLVADCYRC
ncbi:Conserved hypothetical protein [Prochlorococcus marinus str. MIT 9313]|uniref:Uncharacterized protein n=1 Tax=Prochlorococcus marinus (strain MIT 9313) TaxID=74547 RepID=B9ERH5_PROMM|nr:Conserved hypothetical protein [Prochlorococcus marinus str. MIT 9313]